jgi:NADPH-dependent 2,4-dienoyl-CoA reductase/sulfur reductase-like enzyme
VPDRNSTEVATDVLVVGGGLGGVSAALTAVALGGSVILVEELDWLGGQLTAQGIPLDEYPWNESIRRLSFRGPMPNSDRGFDNTIATTIH